MKVLIKLVLGVVLVIAGLLLVAVIQGTCILIPAIALVATFIGLILITDSCLSVDRGKTEV